MQLVSLTKAMRFLIVLTVVCLAAIAVPFSAADSAATAPKGLAFDDKGNLFVSERGGDSIFKFTPEGTRSTFATGLYSSFCSPRTAKRLDRGLRVCSALCALATDQRLAGAPPPRWLF